MATRSPFAAGELCGKEELDTTLRILLRFAGALTGVAGSLRARLLDDAGCSVICQLQDHNGHKLLLKRPLETQLDGTRIVRHTGLSGELQRLPVRESGLCEILLWFPSWSKLLASALVVCPVNLV